MTNDVTPGPPKYLRSTQESYEDSDVPETTRKLMEQPFARGGNRNKNVNRYNLQFYQEGKKELEQMKQEGFKPFEVLSPKQREVDDRYFVGCDFPVRPPWKLASSKEQLDRTENRYFKVGQVYKEKNYKMAQSLDFLLCCNHETFTIDPSEPTIHPIKPL